MSEPRPPLPSEAPRLATTPLLRWAYLLLALFFLLLGLIGAFLPVLPTTPFILLAAWAAARGSPRLLAWLEQHTVFGPMIIDWRRGGVVRRRAKWLATAMMSLAALYLLLGPHPRWAAVLAVLCMLAVDIWLWQRPERHADEHAPPR
jgi:hypothetical protein